MDGAMRNTLTIKAIDRLKPKEKTYRKPDGDNLYLRISPAGGKYWEMRYRRPLDGKEDTLVFGKYPIISLKKARELRAEAQERIALGIDPKAEKNALKLKQTQHGKGKKPPFALSHNNGLILKPLRMQIRQGKALEGG